MISVNLTLHYLFVFVNCTCKLCKFTKSCRILLAQSEQACSGDGARRDVAASRKRSHEWCVSMTLNNTKTIGRMTCHCFLLPIRRDLTSSFYTTRTANKSFFKWKLSTQITCFAFKNVIITSRKQRTLYETQKLNRNSSTSLKQKFSLYPRQNFIV